MSFHIFPDEVRKARRLHFCVWCGQSIYAGESYAHVDAVTDEGFQHQYWHHECLDASREDLEYGDEFSPYDNERPSGEDRN